MKNKKIIISIIVLILIIVMAILGTFIIKNKLEHTEETTTTYKSLDDAIAGYYNEIAKIENEDKRGDLLDNLQNYFLNELNGTYYYNDFAWYIKDQKFEEFEDTRTIYVKNRNEVYIVPFSEEELSQKNVKVNEIDSLDNAEKYKYKVIELTPANGGADGIGIVMKLQSYNIDESAYSSFEEVKIDYYVKYGYYWMHGFWADLSPNGDYSEEIAKTIKMKDILRRYYKNKEDAIASMEVAKQKHEEASKPKVKTKPQIGMTESEVLQSTWGYPNKKNKDTYSWGTTEQWVYDNYGYVYFRNGIVSSISER
jgi:hypothetical protein